MKRLNRAYNFALSLSNSFNALVGGDGKKSFPQITTYLVPRFHSSNHHLKVRVCVCVLYIYIYIYI